MFWPIVKSLVLLIFLVSITWLTETLFGFWPSVGVALLCVVIGSTRVDKYFKTGEYFDIDEYLNK